MLAELAEQCPVCHSPVSDHKWHSGFRLAKCANTACDHVSVFPPPTTSFLQAHYASMQSDIRNSDGYTLLTDYEVDPERVRKYFRKQRIVWLEQHVPNFKDKKTSILDVGCSTGMFLRTLKDAGYVNLLGFDLSTSACQLVRDKHGIQCISDLKNIADDSVDFICCFAVLEHVNNPHEFLTELRAKLKSDGVLFILVPNYKSLYAKISGDSWVWLIPPTHLQYFSIQSLTHLIKSAGYSPILTVTSFCGTYLYLLTYHLMRLLKKEMPSTSRATGFMRNLLINAIEFVLRLALRPIDWYCQLRSVHCEIRLLAKKCATPMRGVTRGLT